MELFTIGHSNLTLEAFITLLQKYEINAVGDVRSYPYSRYLPHFNQKPLQEALHESGIWYVFLGQELGARPQDLSCFINGKALYNKIEATPAFAKGIERVIKGMESYQIALMCAEKDPITCHRSILICQHLRKFKFDIKHILNNGELETHEHLEDRLIKLHNLETPSSLEKMVQLSLFEEEPSIEIVSKPSKTELLKKAYQAQADKIAYVDKRISNYESVS